MHGYKKRRKRQLKGTASLGGAELTWELISEPQWSNSGDGYKGLCLLVKIADAARRELIIEYPYPTDAMGKKLPVPQRPPISESIVATSIQAALDAGWDPGSRGKTFVFNAPPAGS